MKMITAYEKGLIKPNQKISSIEGFSYSNGAIRYKGRRLHTEPVSEYRYKNAVIRKMSDRLVIRQPPQSIIAIDVSNLQFIEGETTETPSREITAGRAVELGLVGVGTDMSLFGLREKNGHLVDYKGADTDSGNRIDNDDKDSLLVTSVLHSGGVTVGENSRAYVNSKTNLVLPDKLTIKFLVDAGYFNRGDFETLGFELGEPQKDRTFMYHPTYKGVEMIGEHSAGANLKTYQNNGLRIVDRDSLIISHRLDGFLVVEFDSQYHVVKPDFEIDIDLMKPITRTTSEEPTEYPSYEHDSNEQGSTEQTSTEQTSTEPPSKKFEKVGELYDGTPVYRDQEGDLIEGDFRDLGFRLMFNAKHTNKTKALFEDLETVFNESDIEVDVTFGGLVLENYDGTEEELKGGLKELLMHGLDIVLMNYDLTPKH